MKFRNVLSLLVLCTLVIVGCSDDPASSNTTANGSVSAKISGTAWSANTVQANWTSNVLHIGASDIKNTGTNNQINIQGLVSGTGTFQLNPLTGLNATYTESSSQGGINVKIFSVTSGTLVVSEISSAGAKGTFSFEAAAQSGSESRSITEGSFDVKFK